MARQAKLRQKNRYLMTKAGGTEIYFVQVAIDLEFDELVDAFDFAEANQHGERVETDAGA
jgi:hypothetical protein